MNMVKYIFGKGKKSGKFMIYEYSKKFDEWQPNFEYPTDMKGKVERDYKELERDAKIFHEGVTAFRKNKKWIIK